MKKIKYILAAFACAVLTGCMGGEDYGFDTDWTAPDTQNAYGNPELKETNVITVAELLQRYVNPMTNANDTVLIKPCQQTKHSCCCQCQTSCQQSFCYFYDLFRDKFVCHLHYVIIIPIH